MRKQVKGWWLCTLSFEWVHLYVKGDDVIVITIITIIIVLGSDHGSEDKD